MPEGRWSDDRLDDLHRRLIKVEDMTTDVAVLKNDVRSMKGTLGRVETGVTDLAKKLDDAVDEPLVRARDFRKQVLQGVIAAMAGGVVVFLATLLAGAVS